MRKFWLFLAVIVIGAGAMAYTVRDGAQGVPEASAQTGIVWASGSFDDALQLARDSGRPMMIDFYATWCGPCKKLAKYTFQDEDVSTLVAEKLVCIKRDAEKDEGAELAKRFLVYNYPTMIFLKPDGTEIDRHVGFLQPPEYMQLVNDYLAGVNTLDDYMRRVQVSPDDAELNFKVGEKLSHRLQSDDARRYLEHAIELDAANDQGYAVQSLFALGDLHRKLAERSEGTKDWDQAIVYTRRAIETYPDENTTRDGLYRIAHYNKKAGRPAAAADNYRELIELDPADPKPLNAFAWFCAKAGHDLDEATEKALLAVKLSKGDPGIIDTLAEVYYARGMYDEAIATINEAIAKDDDAYFRDQLKKFEEARDAASATL
jgi:thiol-disulfide isomerase/thioredoxin